MLDEAHQRETYVMELEGEIILLKDKVADAERVYNMKEMAWNSQYQAMLLVIDDLKAEGVRRYMEYSEYRCSLVLPANQNWQQLMDDQVVAQSRRDYLVYLKRNLHFEPSRW